MRRLGVRLLMAGVGVSVLVFYAVGALPWYWLLAALLANPPPLAQSLLFVAEMTLLLGYLSYQFGTTRLLASLDAVEIPRERAPDLYDRVEELATEMAIQPPRLLVAGASRTATTCPQTSLTG